MNVSDLVRYDIPDGILERWQLAVGERLLPLQEKAVRRHDLFSGGNLLIQAPTSSGKTFVGEMAAVKTALNKKQAVYLVPLKALAEEKFREFQTRYEGYGLRVILSTRDHRDHDAALERGDFDLAVVVYEKLAQLLLRRPERVEEIALVVADELEILGDVERGPGAELLLTRLREQGCRLIGLSAVIGDEERLATWMDAGLIRWDERPLELRSGVLYEGDFHFQVHGGGGGVERLNVDGGESAEETALECLEKFSQAGERSLVFVRARHDTRVGAGRIAAHLDLPAAAEALKSLEALEPTRCRDELMETMGRGVAFHNADLSPEERRIVEEAFRQGEVLVLVSTSTLAVGLNLPARNVFLTTEKWCYDAGVGMPWKAPVTHREYENMGGRAGRLGSGYPFGRAILIATSPFEKEMCWRRYVEGEREPLEPQLDRALLDDFVLPLVVSGTCPTLSRLREFLEKSLTGQWVWLDRYPRDEVDARIRASVHRCVENGMLVAMPAAEDERIACTPLGHAVAGKGVDQESAGLLRAWVETSKHRDWCLADLLYRVAATPAGRSTQVLLTTREFDEAGYVAELRERVRHENLEGDQPLAQLHRTRLQPFFEDVRATKVTLFLLDWLEGISLRIIEERYNAMAGQIMAVAIQFAWLVDALRAIALAEGLEGKFTERLARLAERLPLGVSEQLAEAIPATVPGIGRRDRFALEAAGLVDRDSIAEVSPLVLSRYVDPAAAVSLRAWAKGAPEEKPGVRVEPDCAPEPRLVIDDGRPNEIGLDEHTVPLQRKQYELIRLLAKTPGECVRYETIYDTLWEGVCVEPSQMHYQKRTLLQRIREICPGREKGLIETRNRYGYALALMPESVQWRPARTPVS